MTTRHLPRLLAGALAAFALAGCGGGDGGSGAATPTPTPAAAETIPTVDGLLIAADEKSVTLRTQQGEEEFMVAPADLEAVGIDHLASHAGLTDIGFRVYYKEQGDKRYLKGSEEIAPPF